MRTRRLKTLSKILGVCVLVLLIVVLVISGDSDAIVPVADSRRLHAELPRSELHILPSCGHVPQEECPELFTDAVTTWLNAGDNE